MASCENGTPVKFRSSEKKSKSQDYVPVSEFYAGKSIFVTGGTGFVGKVLVEKLLRSCPKIRNIYLLLRPKKGLDVNSRLNELIHSPLFEKIRMERPEDLQKIVPIFGELTKPDLGLSVTDQEMLCREVSVVFHSAATVRFNEHLKSAVNINMIATQQLIRLCQRMLGLQALVHVSTAYSNCDKITIEERVYPPSVPPEDVISLVNILPEYMIDKITADLLGDHANTYTFTKRLAEYLLLEEAGNLPIAIVRPSIVVTAYREPEEGWVDNYNGPHGILAAAGQGILRVMHGDGSCIADLVPVDIVANLMIAVAWHTFYKKNPGSIVYNCCSGQQNPVTWKYFLKECSHNFRKNPLDGVVWYPNFEFINNRLLCTVFDFLENRLPAHMLDLISTAMGRKPMVVRIQKKIKHTAKSLEYFVLHHWLWSDTNVQVLSSCLSPEDRSTFDFDVKGINWEAFTKTFTLGLKRYLLKDPAELATNSQIKISWLFILHHGLKFGVVLLALMFFYSSFKALGTCLKTF